MCLSVVQIFYFIGAKFINVEAEVGVNPTFEKGRSKYRFELLNYNNFQCCVFCTRIKFLMNTYKEHWDIEDQLNLDINACKSNGIIEYEENQALNTDQPQIKINAVLPFEFNCVENRTSTILSLRSWAIMDHCEEVEQFVMEYHAEWNCWEQLALDFSACLRSKAYTSTLDGADRFLDITNNIRTNVTQAITYNGNDIPYLHNGYITRKMLQYSTDLFLNFFCNRVIFLNDNYDINWKIKTQLETDILACWLMMTVRRNFTRIQFPVSTAPPDIKVTGNLIFNKGAAVDRTLQLLTLGRDRLKHHCTITSDLLKDYNLNWKTIDQMSDDANVCTLELMDPPINSFDFSFETLSIHINKTSTSTDEVINTCKVIANLIQESWRLRKNISAIVISLKMCFWKLHEAVVCDIIDTKPVFEKDSIDLKATTRLLTWDVLKTKNADEVYDTCVQQISKIRHLFLTKTEEKTLFNNLAICVNIFTDNADSNLSFSRSQYYIVYNRILSYDEQIPLCQNALATILKIIFPDSLIGTAYENRRLPSTNEFRVSFQGQWDTKRNSSFYFTNVCDDKDRHPSLCSGLSIVHNNMTVETYCELTKDLLHNTDLNSEELKIISTAKLLHVFFVPWT